MKTLSFGGSLLTRLEGIFGYWRTHRVRSREVALMEEIRAGTGPADVGPHDRPEICSLSRSLANKLAIACSRPAASSRTIANC